MELLPRLGRVWTFAESARALMMIVLALYLYVSCCFSDCVAGVVVVVVSVFVTLGSCISNNNNIHIHTQHPHTTHTLKLTSS